MTFDSRWKNPQGKSPEQLHDAIVQIVRELRKGSYLPTVLSDAADIDYDNTTSGMTADDVQSAIDENDGRLDVLEAAPAGLVLLASGTISDDATLDIPLTAYTGYRAVKIVLSSFVPATDDVELWLRFSTDGGANFDATGYAWSIVGTRDGAATTPLSEGSGSDAAIIIAGRPGNAGESVNNGASEGGVDAEITIFAQAATRWTRTKYQSAYQSADDQLHQWSGGGHRETAQDTDAIRFLFESGNIASGNWAIYGYA